MADARLVALGGHALVGAVVDQDLASSVLAAMLGVPTGRRKVGR